MAADGSDPVNLTNDPGDDQLPYWRPAPPDALKTGESQTAVARASTGTVYPLEDTLDTLLPQDVFQNFYDITQVPRPSGSMDKIREFLVTFGQTLGLETIVDNAGNVIIRKPGATGLEDKPSIVLQAHMDMVAQKEADKDFDFTTDPIEAFVSGETIVTDGTTLGADDGIGIAMIMAVLQSKDLKIGPVEALFTVDEESSMSGANGLDPATLKGRTMINLDGETELAACTAPTSQAPSRTGRDLDQHGHHHRPGWPDASHL